jgi:hypothetical protein
LPRSLEPQSSELSPSLDCRPGITRGMVGCLAWVRFLVVVRKGREKFWYG